MTSLEIPSASGLSDLCAGALRLAVRLRRTKDPGSAEDLRKQVEEIFSTLDRKAQAAGIPLEDVRLARYALAAFIDEIVLGSSFEMRQEWASRPLQLIYFNDFAAGEEFYNKLASLQGRGDPRKLDVLEVYALCLGLGFRGRHGGVAGMDRIKEIMEAVSAEIRAGRGLQGSELSRRWLPEDRLPQKVRNLPVWVVASACGGFLLLLFLVLDIALGVKVSGFLDAVQGTAGGR